MTLSLDLQASTVHCGNCPLNDTPYGCHLKNEECREFTKLVELSMARDYEEYLQPEIQALEEKAK